MAFTWEEWAKHKSKIALALGEGACGGGYAEAALILCAVISGIAAEAWPGKRQDKKRFVEILARYSKVPQIPTTISVPLLLQSLKEENKKKEIEIISTTFVNYDETRILLGTEVDQSEEAIVGVCPELTAVKIRSHSYANLLYELIRSAYAHEYLPDKKASPLPMTRRKSSGISYNNRGERANNSVRRMICFHLTWLSDLAVNLGKEMDASGLSFPLTTPTKWWLDG